jgi:hypothetical protein
MKLGQQFCGVADAVVSVGGPVGEGAKRPSGDILTF